MRLPRIRVSFLRLLVQTAAAVCLVGGAALGLKRVVIYGWKPVLPVLVCSRGAPAADGFLCELQPALAVAAAGHAAPLAALVLSFLLLGMILGRAWCGWVCPLGLVQDLITRLRAVVGLRSRRIAGPARRAMVAGGAFLLALAVGLPTLAWMPGSALAPHRASLKDPFCLVCPGERIFPLVEGNFGAVVRIDEFSGVTRVLSVLGVGLVAYFTVASFVVRRAWCRVCPLGLMMKLLRFDSRALPVLKKNTLRCTGCGACARLCPMDVERVFTRNLRVSEMEAPARKGVRSPWLDVSAPECILCMKCVEGCPADGALEVSWLGIPLLRSSFRRSYASSRSGAAHTALLFIGRLLHRRKPLAPTEVDAEAPPPPEGEHADPD